LKKGVGFFIVRAKDGKKGKEGKGLGRGGVGKRSGVSVSSESDGKGPWNPNVRKGGGRGS